MSKRTKPRRILLVDDDDDFRSSVVMILEAEGWEVKEARDGSEGLRAIRDWKPPVVMLDWRMPIMDGEGVLKSLKEETDRPLVILVTASAHVTDLARRHRVPFYVGKPFEVEHLLAVLDEAHRVA